jgi:hypothetical protein
MVTAAAVVAAAATWRLRQQKLLLSNRKFDECQPLALGNNRCKRFAIYCVDGVVKHMEVSHSDTDPAGDDDPAGRLMRTSAPPTLNR